MCLTRGKVINILVLNLKIFLGLLNLFKYCYLSDKTHFAKIGQEIQNLPIHRKKLCTNKHPVSDDGVIVTSYALSSKCTYLEVIDSPPPKIASHKSCKIYAKAFKESTDDFGELISDKFMIKKECPANDTIFRHG